MKQNSVIDGLNRSQYEAQIASLRHFKALESDWRILFNRVMKMSKGIYYFNTQNQKEGYLHELWKNQALSVFMEIMSYDTQKLEAEFIRYQENYSSAEFLLQLTRQIDNWTRQLTNYNLVENLKEKTDSANPYTRSVALINSHLSESLSQNHLINPEEKDIFYNRIMTIRRVQENMDEYICQLEENGDLDPSLSVLLVFLRNYEEITKRFNNRLEILPDFYFKEILKTSLRAALPDKTWITLKKNPGPDVITVQAGTGFIAGKNEDQSTFCYHSTEKVYVSDIHIRYLSSLYEKRDPFRLPGGRIKEENTGLSFVTSVEQQKLATVPLNPQKLFDSKEDMLIPTPLGLLIESSILLLREGRRTGTIRLFLTSDSVKYLQKMLEQAYIPNSSQEKKIETIYKLFLDAFYLKISTSAGWEAVPLFLQFKEKEQVLLFTFELDENFPPTIPCEEEKHGITTLMPAIQIVPNENAWLYPYSWATHTQFHTVTLQVKVEEITSLKVYGEAGTQDTTLPFYPFGVQARKNAWMVFGNYEMSLKPLQKVTLKCKWQNLPVSENGYEGHYREYHKNITNDSFRIRTEYLHHGQWISTECNVPLFRFSSPSSKIEEESVFDFIGKEKISAAPSDEETYDYHLAQNGFLRMVLDQPDIGFGDALYREVFSQTLIHNGKHTHQRPLPQEPLSPMISNIRLSYTAEDTFQVFNTSSQGIRILHICPMWKTQFFPVVPGKTFHLIFPFLNRGNLLLGLENAIGFDRIRFYLNLVPSIQNRRTGKTADNLPEINWYFLNNKQWTLIDKDYIEKDGTSHLTASGIVEIILPEPFAPEDADAEGICWLQAAIEKKPEECAFFNGIYMHAVEVIADGGNGKSLPIATITEPENTLPGIIEIQQFLPGSEGRPAENEASHSIRIAHRIAHRNRMVCPTDYERMVLSEFPEISKVKCFPGNDSENAVAILVVIPQEFSGDLPLCSYRILDEIQHKLQPLTSPMTKLKVINPVYEEISLRCHIQLHSGSPETETLQRITKKINQYIAPWLQHRKTPAFGYRPSLKGMHTILCNDEGVKSICLSVLQVTEQKDCSFELKEYPYQKNSENSIVPSYPWSILVPAKKHFIMFTEKDESAVTIPAIGLDELVIGKTFIITE